MAQTHSHLIHEPHPPQTLAGGKDHADGCHIYPTRKAEGVRNLIPLVKAKPGTGHYP